MRARRTAGEPVRTVRAAAPTGKKRDPGDTLKIPMPDQVNELVVLAACLVDIELRKKLAAILPADSFFAPGHAEAWAVAVLELERRGLTYDPATVKQLSGGAVDTDYLDELIAQRPSAPPNIQHHVDQLRWDRARVEGVRGPVQGLLDALKDPLAEPDKVRAFARQVGTAFDGFGTQRYLRDPNQLRRSAMQRLRDRRAGQACYPYGLPGLDWYGADEGREGWRMIPGVAPSQTTVVTGVPGSGKTTVTAALAIAQINAGRRVLFGAWEQGAEATLELMASQSLGYSRTDLSTGAIDDEAEAALDQEMDRLNAYVRFVELPFGRDRGEWKDRHQNDKHLDLIQEMIAMTGAQVAIFDLWRRSLRDFDPDEEERALYRQQAIAQETKCHCILIHQLRAKDLESRVDKRPTREALKGSSAWFEVPDTILGVHREFLFKDVPDDKLQLVVLKQRHGIFPMAVEFDWDADRGLLDNGRGVAYERAGQQGMGAGGDGIDAFLSGGAGALKPATSARSRGGKGRRS